MSYRDDRDPELRTCRLCRSMSPDVRCLLVRIKRGRTRFGSIERCRDSIACRARVETANRRWLVDDNTPAVGAAR